MTQFQNARFDFQLFWESGCLSSSQLPLDQWSVTLAHDLTSTFSMQIIKKWKSFGQCKENCKTNKNKYFGVTQINIVGLEPEWRYVRELSTETRNHKPILLLQPTSVARPLPGN